MNESNVNVNEQTGINC